MKKAILAVATLLTLSLLTFGRVYDKPTLTGKWHFVLDTPGGDREADSSLEETAGKVTGKWGFSNGSPGADVKGTYTDGNLAMEMHLEETEAGPGTMKITGHLADDGTLTGEWAFADYNGNFKATPIKADAPK